MDKEAEVAEAMVTEAMVTEPTVAGVMLLGLLPGSANAAVIWDGDASRGTGVFGHIGSNCASPGSVTAVTDSTHGRVWRYDKPSGSDRCESRGITVGSSQYTFTDGSTYYFGWRSKLSNTVNNNATFQWKSYGDHIQNWVHTIWSTPDSANVWNRIVLGLHISDATTGGWVELWYNGQKQTFSNGSQRWACRTLDDENHPKWGVYGASGSAVIHYVDALKVGTSYSDVAP